MSVTAILTVAVVVCLIVVIGPHLTSHTWADLLMLFAIPLTAIIMAGLIASVVKMPILVIGKIDQ